MTTEKNYAIAREIYAGYGVDASAALEAIDSISLSLHCWQGDDCGGFEGGGAPGGGLAVTGNYPGKANTPGQLRADIDKALSLIPGTHRLNLHAFYAETLGDVPRDQLSPEHFANWLEWAKERRVGLDFNPTFFAHQMASSGFTLSSADPDVRAFWIRHAIACRNIARSFGESLGTPCINNFWIPDGYKDIPYDRASPRARLSDSLDQIFEESIDESLCRDALESKLFGIGSECYVTGSHEFYLGYAARHSKMLCLDTGHFHPTESIADKISSTLMWVPGILLHISRGVRWDSDHVALFTDDVRSIAEEIVRGDCLERVRIGLDYFDASINRVAAWVIGARSTQKALLAALLEPSALLRESEATGDFTKRLVLIEESKNLPLGAVWDYYCLSRGVPVGASWLEDVIGYECDNIAKR